MGWVGPVVGTNKVKKDEDSMDLTIIWNPPPRRPQDSKPTITSQKQPNGVRIIDAGEDVWCWYMSELRIIYKTMNEGTSAKQKKDNGPVSHAVWKSPKRIIHYIN